MALTEEQRSLLQLLLSGGQGYDDIASLLGTSSDEVRERAGSALAEIGGADPDADVALTDYLLGKADPIGRADAVRHLQNDPESNALAQRVVDQLRLLAPSADLPQIPEPRGGRASAPARRDAAETPASAPDGGSRGPGLMERLGGSGDPERRKIAIAAALAGVLVLAIVAAVFIFGGDDDDGDDSASADQTATAAADENLVIVGLAPLQSGSEAGGQAVFAQAQNQPVLQINLTGLEPSGQGQSYIVWLYNSDRVAFPLARDSVAEDGNLTGAAAIPQEVLPLLGQFGCIDVSLASNREAQRALQAAVENESLPAFSGESVLRGEIPTAAGQEAPTGADAQCDRTAQAGAGAGGGNGAGGGATP